jgi:hypothetical protein
MPSKPACALTTAWLLAATAAWLVAPPPAGAVPALDQAHGLRGTARYDAGLYTAYCPRGRRLGAGAPALGQDAAVQPHQAPEAQPEGDGEASGAADEASTGEAETETGTDSESEFPWPDAEGPPEIPASFDEARTVAHAASTSEAGWPAKQCLKMDKGGAGTRRTLVGLDGLHNWLLGGYGNDTIIGGDSGDVIWADYHPSGEPRSQTAVIRAGNGRNVIYANDTRNYVWTGTNPRTVVHAHVSGIFGVIHCQSHSIVV